MKVYLFLKNNLTKLRNSGSSGGTVNRDPKVIGVKRDGFQINDGGGGRDNFEELQVDLEVIDNAINADSYVMMSVMRHSELVSKSGYYFKGVNEQALEYLKLRLAFMEVGTKMTTETLVKEIINDLVRYSNAFFIKARSKKGEGLPPGVPITPILPSKAPIAGYFRVHPKTMTIARDEFGEVLRYKQEVQGGESKEFAPEDVIHFTLNKPSGRAFSVPWISPVLEDIRLLRKIEENVAILIYKHIFPLLTYTVGQNKEGLEATDNEVDTVKEEIQNLPVDGILVMPERHKLESLKLNPIEVSEYLKYFENRVFSGLGMSQLDMGRGDTANRNTADSMDSQKIDRVKDWQKQIQDQIDSHIINELLVEGGFDPLANAEFDIDFIFEEIENEKRIALENHAINKFNNNLITFEEARILIGEEVTVDEARLRFNMIDSSSVVDGAVDNAVKPENQHGKKDSPKVKEYLRESEENRDYQHTMMMISSELFESLRSSLQNNKNFSCQSQILEESIYKTIKEQLIGSEEIALLESYSRDWIRKTTEFIDGVYQEAKKEEAIADQLLFVGIQQERVNSRIKQFEEYVSEKIFNIKKLKTYFNEGYAARVQTNNCCSICEEKAKIQLDQDSLSETEKRSLYFFIPPYHSGCKCSVKRKEM